jgi:hypothetical protein
MSIVSIATGVAAARLTTLQGNSTAADTDHLSLRFGSEISELCCENMFVSLLLLTSRLLHPSQVVVVSERFL